MTYEYPNITFDPNLLELMKSHYKFVALDQNEANLITKMCTHFHRYPRLYFFVEVDLFKDLQLACVKIIAHHYDQSLISDSGY